MARAAGPQRPSCSSSSAVSPDAWFRPRNIGRKPSVGAAGSLLEREAWVLSIAETIEASQALPTDVMRAEGPAALFKGWGAHYLRGAPHVALLFLSLEQLKRRWPLG